MKKVYQELSKQELVQIVRGGSGLVRHPWDYITLFTFGAGSFWLASLLEHFDNSNHNIFVLLATTWLGLLNVSWFENRRFKALIELLRREDILPEPPGGT